MKILYVTDLDGTLLNSSSRVSPYSLSVINTMVENGLLFTYATARSLTSASVVAKGLSAQIPIIGYNGTIIFQPATGEMISNEGFQYEEYKWIEHILKKHNVSPFVYSFIKKNEKKIQETVSWIEGTETEGMKHYLSLRSSDEKEAKEKDLIYDKRLRPLSYEEEEKLYEGDVFYCTCIGERENLLPAFEEIVKEDRYTCLLQQEPHTPEEYWLEIMPRKATKANAIKKLKELWQCDKIVCFGDGLNDIPMFQIAEESYAMENGAEQLKQMATAVIGRNDDDAVAKWLKENAILYYSDKAE